jgi:glycerol uptake facilitator-like aquaporin
MPFFGSQGELSAGDFFALSAAEILGAFIGAVLVWIHFLPHFKTVPEPPTGDPVADLMRTRDYIDRNARQYASYNTQVAEVRLSVCTSAR